jgi:hypothetical protein
MKDSFKKKFLAACHGVQTTVCAQAVGDCNIPDVNPIISTQIVGVKQQFKPEFSKFNHIIFEFESRIDF